MVTGNNLRLVRETITAVEDDPTTCIFFFPFFDVALRPSVIFLDDRFMPSFLLFSLLHCPYDTFDNDHGLFTAVFPFFSP
jgi:hypothetical protein